MAISEKPDVRNGVTGRESAAREKDVPGKMTKPGGETFFPNPYPPIPGPQPAMMVGFKYQLGEPVEVKDIGISGIIICAAVAFQEANNIYLLETSEGHERWYSESMIRPRRMYVKSLADAMGEEKSNEAG